jgi:hypothetical protein
METGRNEGRKTEELTVAPKKRVPKELFDNSREEVGA